MLQLNLETTLLIWILVSTLAHEYGHSFMAKICGYKTFGFFANPIPGVLMEHPRKEMHGVLILAGGWIFGAISILLFLPFVSPEYIFVFLIAALAIEIVLSGMSDFMGILAIVFKKYNSEKMWEEYFFKNVAKEHNQKAKYGLSKIAIVDRVKYKEILKEAIQGEHSVAFFDKVDAKGLLVLFSLLALSSALMVALVNYPVFSILTWFGVEIEADFSVFFWTLAGTSFMLTITERLILRESQKE